MFLIESLGNAPNNLCHKARLDKSLKVINRGHWILCLHQLLGYA